MFLQRSRLLCALVVMTLLAAACSSPENNGESDVGYLPADQVDAYVDAFEQGLAKSSVTIDGTTLPVDYAGFETMITVLIDQGAVWVEVGDEDLEEVSVHWQGREWVAPEEPEIDSLPEPLGGDGDTLDMNFTAVAADGSSDSIDVQLTLQLDVIGMGDSIVEVIDEYATISGTLGTLTYVQLVNVMANSPEVDTLVMLNVHGSENDDINVHTARLVRAAGWTTWVPSNGDISSGGVDMFAAGIQRIVEPGGFVGVHSWGVGDGEVTARDYPRDSPAHRSQLEYFTEMMGDEAGTEFYFYTLDASPFDEIYRMTPVEMTGYGLITGEATKALPSSIVGPPAGYLELARGTYLKLEVSSCRVGASGVDAELLSVEFGPLNLSVEGDTGELSLPALDGVAAVDHEVSEVGTVAGVVSGVVNLDIAALVADGLDTSNAAFEFPCPA